MPCPKCRGQQRWPLFLFFVAAVVLATVALAAEPALSLEEAGRLAVERQPQLIAQEAGVAALREEAIAAGQLPDPRLTVGIEGLPTDSFSLTREPMTQTVFGLSQMIPGGDKRMLASRRIEHAATREAVALEAGRRRIVRATRLAWLDAYAAERELALSKALEAEFMRQTEWDQVAYKTGQIGQDETLAQRVALAGLRNRLHDIEGKEARARAGLARWLGDVGNRPLTQTDPLPSPPDTTTLADRLDKHPEIRALQADIDAGRTDGDLARQAYRPDWSVDLSYGIRGEGRTDTLKLMVGVDLPIFPAQRQDRRVAAKLAEVNRMEAMREDRRRELAADIATAAADWRSADNSLKRLQADIQPLAKRRTDSALVAYQAGKAGYGRVLEARRAELETQLEQLNLEMARARAAVMLQYYE